MQHPEEFFEKCNPSLGKNVGPSVVEKESIYHKTKTERDTISLVRLNFNGMLKQRRVLKSPELEGSDEFQDQDQVCRSVRFLPFKNVAFVVSNEDSSKA